MRIVIATDKYKGSLTALEAARAMRRGVLDVAPAADVELCPMADGGEGTLEALAAAAGAELRRARVSGPLPESSVEARWAFMAPGAARRISSACRAGMPFSGGAPTAVIEMAQASGLSLVPPGRRDPTETSTLGTGELMREALDAGCLQMIVGIGGSATVDGGTGMACALGYRFLDSGGRELPPVGGSLEKMFSIDYSGRDPRLAGARVVVASDVDNPLVGPEGAARVYGPQKGAAPEQVESLERGLANLAALIRRDLGVDVLEMGGAGAAGGLGAGLAAFCGGVIASGVEIVGEAVGLREAIAGADLVLTGEGRFDAQTARGKTPDGVAAAAREEGVPVIVVAGSLEGDRDPGWGEDVALHSVCPGPMGLEEAMSRASELVRHGTARLMRVVELARASRWAGESPG